MEIKLKHEEYINVCGSYGGSQSWFTSGDEKRLCGFGCGVIAANDTLLYLEGRREFARLGGRAVPVIVVDGTPMVGFDPARLASHGL